LPAGRSASAVANLLTRISAQRELQPVPFGLEQARRRRDCSRPAPAICRTAWLQTIDPPRKRGNRRDRSATLTRI